MIAIGSDHASVLLRDEIKKHLDEIGVEYVDLSDKGDGTDYPDIAKVVCKRVLDGGAKYGILLCGTGIGISISANKIKGIRAALCGDYYSAKYTRLHNDANVLCMGGRVTGVGPAIEMVDVFLNTEFEGGRHANRINKIKLLEDENG